MTGRIRRPRCDSVCLATRPVCLDQERGRERALIEIQARCLALASLLGPPTSKVDDPLSRFVFFLRSLSRCVSSYGMASVSRIDKIIGLFCKRALLKRRYSAKETYNFIDPTDRCHPIVSSWGVPTHCNVLQRTATCCNTLL